MPQVGSAGTSPMPVGHALTPGFSSGEMINYLRGAAPLALATKSSGWQRQWKCNTAESMSAMMLVGFWCQDLLVLVSQDALFFSKTSQNKVGKSLLCGVRLFALYCQAQRKMNGTWKPLVGEGRGSEHKGHLSPREDTS